MIHSGLQESKSHRPILTRQKSKYRSWASWSWSFIVLYLRIKQGGEIWSHAITWDAFRTQSDDLWADFNTRSGQFWDNVCQLPLDAFLNANVFGRISGVNKLQMTHEMVITSFLMWYTKPQGLMGSRVTRPQITFKMSVPQMSGHNASRILAWRISGGV